MEEQNIEARLQALEAKIDAMYVSVEKLRKYFLWTGIITLVVIVVPLLIIPFMLPSFFAAEGVGALQGF
jgi:hypothetical protein